MSHICWGAGFPCSTNRREELNLNDLIAQRHVPNRYVPQVVQFDCPTKPLEVIWVRLEGNHSAGRPDSPSGDGYHVADMRTDVPVDVTRAGLPAITSRTRGSYVPSQ